MISPVLIGGFVAMDRALLCMPSIGKKQGVILEQKMCSTTPIKLKSHSRGPKPIKNVC